MSCFLKSIFVKYRCGFIKATVAHKGLLAMLKKWKDTGDKVY